MSEIFGYWTCPNCGADNAIDETAVDNQVVHRIDIHTNQTWVEFSFLGGCPNCGVASKVMLDEDDYYLLFDK